ncbi:methyl viologen resistance protein SmvA [Salmonella enterica subsp. enterica serovar Typhi]|nr:methyl viologen resistance protein SmvA [Salmonella enterica subsp. enterica serovar Typhi]CGK74506.1 methyl viologen resistance protein SmvA [Salmonella enterica subsp. enterica serovar Typhi]CGK79279.1 methyl viologen resistance protein SmvA [Salmonella enterica subsp. enterica serovar Typhi]CGK82867.1 methyl viologen resistance protein SmvA [Salmonella enterica subsp. enterica serovar Typhi]CGU10288.1 methyl viologen resistance protein SmvA [Salmonella enterica subsp. enterica serovar Typ
MVFKRGIGHFRNTQHIHTVQPAHQCDKPPGDIRGVSSKRKFSCLFALLDNCDRFLMPHLHREEISISDVRVPVGQNLRLSPQFYVRLKAAVFATQHSVKPCTPGGGRRNLPGIEQGTDQMDKGQRFVLEHFYWGSVFLINVPIVLVVMGLTARYVPRQAGRRDQPLNLGHAVMLIIAILLLVYSAKTALKGNLSLWVISLTLLTGALLLGLFIRTQLATSRPMIDMRLFTHRIILSGVVMAMTAMITLVGFELLMAQELQFVHGLSPYEAGVFMLPVMVASGFSGPIAGALVSRLGLRLVATGGMALSALSFYGLAMTDFSTQQWQAWGLMALLGFSTASALLASTSAIMAAVPAEKAAAAGAIETMAYELGAGLGIAIFGLLLSRSFSASIRLPAGLEAQEIARASSSMGEAVQLANSLPPTQGQAILDAARHAFIWSHSVALSSAGSMLLLLAVGMWFSLAKAQRR